MISFLLVATWTRNSVKDVILACKDNCIRLIHLSSLYLSIPVDSPATTLAFESNENLLLYGLESGSIGCISYDRKVSRSKLVWLISDEKRIAVTVMQVHKLFPNSNASNIIVGRDDGRVQVYQFQDGNSFSTIPQLVFSRDIEESVRAIECGVVNTPGFPEIVVAAFSGKCIAST